MSDRLQHARTGERWVVRVRRADGSATDVVGWLDAVEVDTVRLTGPDQTSWSVSRAGVLAARRVPAAAGGPDPVRISAARLERHALTGWQADAEPLGEWTLRAAGGFTGRANSAHAVGDPGIPVAAAADRVVAYAARHAIAPMAMVVTGSAEEQGLRDLGWVDTYVPVDVLAARLADLLADRPVPEGGRVTETLEPSWRAAYGRSRPTSADPALVRRILDGVPPRAFADAERDGATVAIGRGHLSGPWLGLAAVWVEPAYRRAGWATAIVTALGHWAARRGARYVYAQVDTQNTAALAAYARLGLRRHHTYGYLRPP